MYEVEKNTSVCFPERAMAEWNFENDNGSNSCMKYAKQYVEKWDETYKKGLGLLLWGDVGTGKTYMAACIANALLEQEKRIYDRVLEYCQPICVKGENHRREKSR